MKKLILIILSILLSISCQKDLGTFKNPDQNKLFNHPWYDGEGSKKDSILVPQFIDLSLYIKNIQNLDTNDETYRLSGETSYYSQYLQPIVDYENDTILDPFDYPVDFNYIYDKDGMYMDRLGVRQIIPLQSEQQILVSTNGILPDSLSVVRDTWDVTMFHEWDLRKFPFDTQKLTIKYNALQDTSIIRLRHSKIFPSSFSKKNDLKQGFKIENITFYEDFLNTSNSADWMANRNYVYSLGVFEIEISRSGSWVFIKLFFGGILALVLSWLVFLIPVKDFGDRIELSIGAVFAAVGNKYFVDAATNTQVLTVADIFNNIIILMVVLNIALIIVKRNPVLTNSRLNDTKSLSVISIITAIILFTLLILYVNI